MSAPVNTVEDLRKLANVGEYSELREAMEQCLRPHERDGFASLLQRMGKNVDAIAELIEASTEARRIISMACIGNTLRAHYRDTRAIPALHALDNALARIRGVK